MGAWFQKKIKYMGALKNMHSNPLAADIHEHINYNYFTERKIALLLDIHFRERLHIYWISTSNLVQIHQLLNFSLSYLDD